jgi:hypothetical protein
MLAMPVLWLRIALLGPVRPMPCSARYALAAASGLIGGASINEKGGRGAAGRVRGRRRGW